MLINITGGSNTLYYILKDHLGPASVVTDSSGNPVGEQRYYPYGETRLSTGTINTDKLFTGQRDVGLGIYHYNARFYSPYITQFSQPDSIIPDLNNPQALNRYAYALNNPIRYNDPSGHWSCDDQDEKGNCIIYAREYNRSIKKSDKTYDPKDLHASDKLKEDLKTIEGGWSQIPYNDLSHDEFRHDVQGRGQGTCTIGYGHALHPGPCNGKLDAYYKKNPISYGTALRWFGNDVRFAEQVIKDSVHVKLTQSQFDALVSYIFNSGGEPENPYHEKGIPNLLNKGKYYEAAMVIDSGPYTSDGANLDVLEERRHQEATLFLTGP